MYMFILESLFCFWSSTGIIRVGCVCRGVGGLCTGGCLQELLSCITYICGLVGSDGWAAICR